MTDPLVSTSYPDSIGLPIADIRYNLDTFEFFWATIAYRIDSDIIASTSTHSPFPSSTYSLDGNLYTQICQSLHSGITSMHYFSNQRDQHFNNFYTTIYFELITMSPYPDDPQINYFECVQNNPTSISAIQDLLEHNKSETQKWNECAEQKSLYFDQDLYSKVIHQDKIPHNNIILRMLWLLCDILRIIRSLPLQLDHPCIQQLLHVSTYIWTLFNSILLILFPHSTTLPFSQVHETMWTIYPHSQLILDNLSIPVQNGSAACIIEICQQFLMKPLPFIRHLQPYQAYVTSYPSQNSNHQYHPHPPQHSHDVKFQAAIPSSNKHSPNNFFLLLSQYTLLSPISRKDNNFKLKKHSLVQFQSKPLPCLSNCLQKISSDRLERFHQVQSSNTDTPQSHLPPSSPANPSIINPYAHLSHLTSSTPTSPTQLSLTSIPSLLLDFPQISLQYVYPDPDQPHQNNINTPSQPLEAEFSYSVAQIWLHIFSLFSTRVDGSFIRVAFFHKFKLLNILKDQIERSILSIQFSSGKQDWVQLQNYEQEQQQLVNSLNGRLFLNFLQPFGSKHVPLDILTTYSNLVSNPPNSVPFSDLDSELQAGINLHFQTKQSRERAYQNWLNGGTFSQSSSHLSQIVDNIEILNQIPRNDRHEFSFQLYSGNEFRNNDNLRTLVWTLFIYSFIARFSHDIFLPIEKQALLSLSQSIETKQATVINNTFSQIEIYSQRLADLLTNQQGHSGIDTVQACDLFDKNGHDSHLNDDPNESPQPTYNLTMSAESQLENYFTNIERLQYFDQFTHDSIYIMTLVVLCYRYNNVSFSSYDLCHFHLPLNYPSHIRHILHCIDQTIFYLIQPGGFCGNPVLFSLLFTNPNHLFTAVPGTTTIFDPITTIPFHNINISSIVDPSSQEHNPIHSNITNTSSFIHEVTKVSYYTPLLDILVDYQLQSSPFAVDPTNMNFKSIQYLENSRFTAVIILLLFFLWDPTLQCGDTRTKEFIGWIWKEKKSFIQLCEQSYMLFNCRNSLFQKYPMIPSSLTLTESIYPSVFSSVCLPLIPQFRNLPERGIYYTSSSVYQSTPGSFNQYNYAAPLEFQSLQHVTTSSQYLSTVISTRYSALQLTHRIRKFQQSQQSQQLQPVQLQLTLFDPINSSQIPQIYPQQFDSLFTINTPQQLQHSYRNQFEYINTVYFTSNLVPILLSRIQTHHAFQLIVLLKYRFARYCLAYSQQSGIPLNINLFQNRLHARLTPFNLDAKVLYLMPQSHLDAYRFVNTDNPNSAANYNTKFASLIYDAQHFLALFTESNSDGAPLFSLNSPSLELIHDCQAISHLVPKTTATIPPTTTTTATTHPLMSQLWQRFSMLSPYQHYVMIQYLNQRDWVLEEEVLSHQLFSETQDPIFSYFNYISHMLHHSLDFQSNLPILHHFLFTVNHHALHFRFSRFVYSSIIDWHSVQNSKSFEFVWTLDHIYRLALERCLLSEEALQLLQHKKISPPPIARKKTMQSPSETIISPSKRIKQEEQERWQQLYSPSLIAPIIHQHIEFLSSIILSASYAAFAHPHWHDRQQLAKSFYPSYSDQILDGWHDKLNRDGYSAKDELARSLEESRPYDEDEQINKISHEEDRHLDTVAFNTLLDRRTYQINRTRKLPQFNSNIYFFNFKTHLFNSQKEEIQQTVLKMFADSKHPMIQLLYTLQRKNVNNMHLNEFGMTLPPHYFTHFVKGKREEQILEKINQPLITLPATIKTPHQYTPPSSIQSNQAISFKHSYKQPIDPLAKIQPLSLESFSFQIQYCVESFIDLMLLCDSLSANNEIVDYTDSSFSDSSDSDGSDDSDSDDDELDGKLTSLSHVCTIFNSIDFTIPMNIPTTIDCTTSLSLDSVGLRQYNGSNFTSLLSTPPATTTINLFESPSQIPIAPMCGLVLPNKNIQFGYHQPHIFQTPEFQTYHYNSSTQLYSINPVLRGISDIIPSFDLNCRSTENAPDDPHSFNESILLGNLQIHIDEYRKRLYNNQHKPPV